MAGHAARLGTPSARVNHIQELTAEIAAQMQIASHLMTVVFKAAYDFLTAACLVAGVVFLSDGRTSMAEAWGGAGLVLAVIWLSSKGALRVLRSAVLSLRAELAEPRQVEPRDGVEPTVAQTRPSTTEGRAGPDK